MADASWAGWVQKKAFKVLTKSSWKRRWLKFDGVAFSLAWSDSDKTADKPKSVFQLDPNEIEYKACEDHKKPFEVKVSSKGQTLFFCLESVDQLNNLMARIDAARRLKVASVESNGSVFRSEADVSSAGNGISPGEPGPKVMSWGVGILLGIGKDGINGMSVPQRIAHFRSSPAVSIVASGPEHAAALTDDAQVHMWGSNEFYQLSQPQDVSSCPRPTPLPAFMGKRVLFVACGGSHSLGVVADGGSGAAGFLFAWGTGTVGQLGLGNAAQILDRPQRVELPAGPAGKPQMVTSAYAGLVSSACLADSGACYVWGDASAGRLGLPGIQDTLGMDSVPTFVNGTLVWAPTQVKFDPAVVGLGPAGTPCKVVNVALGGSFTLFLLWSTGPGCILVGSGALGVDITRDSYGYPPKEDREVQAMIDEEVKIVLRKPTPSVFMPFGPKPVVLDAFAGARHAAVVVADDMRMGAPRLYTAGKGWLGHSGQPDSVLLDKPLVRGGFEPVAGVLSEEDVVQAGCGHSHTVARTSDGRIFSWGRGDSGELGHGNLSDRSMPISCRPVDMHSWSSVTAGSYYSIGTVEPSFGPNKPPVQQVLEGFRSRWMKVAAAQDDASKASVPEPSSASAASAGPAKGKQPAGGKVDPKAAKEKAAQEKAREQLDAGELPPNWNWEQTDDGEVYYIQPDGETQWDDPREDWDTYWKFFMD